LAFWILSIKTSNSTPNFKCPSYQPGKRYT
jgi:hypothetical protein